MKKRKKSFPLFERDGQAQSESQQASQQIPNEKEKRREEKREIHHNMNIAWYVSTDPSPRKPTDYPL